MRTRQDVFQGHRAWHDTPPRDEALLVCLRQIDADPLRYSGREQAYTGRIMGMTGTALLLLLAVLLFGSD